MHNRINTESRERKQEAHTLKEYSFDPLQTLTTIVHLNMNVCHNLIAPKCLSYFCEIKKEDQFLLSVQEKWIVMQ